MPSLAASVPELQASKGAALKNYLAHIGALPLPADILSKEESWLAERLKKQAAKGQFKGKRVKELINKAQYSTGYCP